jgi:Amt family ammonium transporter
LIIGTLASGVCYTAVIYIRGRLKIDDSLDVFAVHGVGGILGTLIIPFLAGLGPMAPGLGEMTFASKLGAQITGVASVSAFSGVVSALILLGVRQFVALRVRIEEETNGLDTSTHGESAHGHG